VPLPLPLIARLVALLAWTVTQLPPLSCSCKV
jgi:hypothetical protein